MCFPWAPVLWDACLVSYALPALFSLWFSFCYSMHCSGGEYETNLRWTGHLSCWPLLRWCISSVWLPELSAFVSSPGSCIRAFRCVSSVARAWHWSAHPSVVEPAHVLLCVLFILASGRGFHRGHWLWLVSLSLWIYGVIIAVVLDSVTVWLHSITSSSSFSLIVGFPSCGFLSITRPYYLSHIGTQADKKGSRCTEFWNGTLI